MGWGGGRGRETKAMSTGQEKWEEEKEGEEAALRGEEGNVSPARLGELRGRGVRVPALAVGRLDWTPQRPALRGEGEGRAGQSAARERSRSLVARW